MKTETLQNNKIVQSINLTNPVYQLNTKEFDEALLSFGSFLSIINNKRINQTMLLVALLEQKEVIESFKLLSGVDKPQILLYNLIMRFPVLCKSKIIKNKINELTDDGKRAIDL